MGLLVKKDLLSWCDDLHQVKGNISQFQATLHHILSKAPSIQEFREVSEVLELDGANENKSIMEKTKGFLKSSQLKVAVRMKFLYEQGMLPFLLALSQINFKSLKADKFVGYLLDYTPPRGVGGALPQVLKQRVSGKTTTATDAATDAVVEQGVERYEYPPALPPISDPGLLTTVLTDRSFRQPTDFLELAESSDFSRTHNAKLSLRGHSLLEFVLTDILDTNLPNTHEDDLYYFRSKLMAPIILTKLTFGYNLVDGYRYQWSNKLGFDTKLKIFSKIFLAYVGGLSVDGYSVDEIKFWIGKLFHPIIQQVKNQYHPLKPFGKLALIELDFLFQQVTSLYAVPLANTLVVFETLETDPHVIKLVVNGLTLGIGTSSVGPEEAKEKAASDAFSNKEKLDEILSHLINAHTHLHQKTPEDDEVLSPEEPPYSPVLDEPYSPQPSAEPQEQLPDQSLDQLHQPKPNIPPRPQPYYAPPPALPLTFSINPAAYNDPNLPVDNNAKNYLYAILGSNHLTPIYNFSKVGNEFQVSISVNDILIGSSHDSNKKIASQRAAMNALANTSAWKQLGITI